VIPRIIPPLTGLSILVTRPLPQAHALANSIAKFGGDPIVFPAIAIQALNAVAPEPHDLIIFVSVNAVEHGASLIQRIAGTRIAAIGKATAAALSAANTAPDIVPDSSFTSEALLALPELQLAAGQRVLIVRGEGGRETLHKTLTTQGLVVNTLEVYRRVKPATSLDAIAALEQRWAEDGIDAVTATSVETFKNLVEILSDRGRELLKGTLLVAPTRRIIDAAIELGWNAEALVAGSADDAAILGSLARWQTRARHVSSTRPVTVL
jgi:uroporphyrinogen-III synthase